MSISPARKKEVVQKYQLNEKDTGSSEVQIAIMSERIRNLTGHLKTHPHDFATRRGLFKLIGKRRRLLDYLKKKNLESYRSLIKDLGLRY